MLKMCMNMHTVTPSDGSRSAPALHQHFMVHLFVDLCVLVRIDVCWWVLVCACLAPQNAGAISDEEH